jgi:hypothetical protein
MSGAGRFLPATARRAFFILATIATPAFAGPPPSATPPPLAQVGKPNPAESAKILDQFRHSGWLGYVEFDLRALPRRGEEKVYHGRLWGGRNEQGAVTRIEITDAQGAVRRLLLQNGEHAGVWRLMDGKVARVDGSVLLEPLIPGVEVTAFDLQMPYLYWPDAKVENVARVRGRPAYEFVFHPPIAENVRYAAIGFVRAYFDAQFNAPVQTEIGDTRGVAKTMSLVDLKKVGEQWVPKSFDVRNEVSRDKTRFEVTAVALNLQFPPGAFAPAALAESVNPPPADKIVRIAQ